MDQLDRTRFGPPDDTPIIPWYGGAYSRGFIAFHPFFSVDGLNPDSCEYGTLVLESSDRPAETELVKWLDEEAAQRRVGKEIAAQGIDAVAKRFGKPIEWQAICQHANFADHCSLDRALRTSIGGLRHELADYAGADRLAAYCAQHRIFPPSEGRMEPLMQRGLASLFNGAGFAEIIVGDEFGDDERRVDINLLEQDELWDGRPEFSQYGVRRLMAPDRSLLAWVHWDSFYTLLLLAEAHRELEIDRLFEGFWCSDQTSTYWLSQGCIPCTSDRGLP